MAEAEVQLKQLRVRFGFDSPLDRLMFEAAPSMRRSLLRSMAEEFIRYEAAGGAVPLEGSAVPRGTARHLIGKPFFVRLSIDGPGTLNDYLRGEAVKGAEDLSFIVRKLAQRSLTVAARVTSVQPAPAAAPAATSVPGAPAQPAGESAPTDDRQVDYHQEFTDASLGRNRQFGEMGGLSL
jgi:hypothetical protein